MLAFWASQPRGREKCAGRRCAYRLAAPCEFPSLQKPVAFQSVSERFMSFFMWGIHAKNAHVSEGICA